MIVLGGLILMTDVRLPEFGGDFVEIAVVDVSDHDPLGDQRERPDLVDLAVDGDPGTAWTTETYERADLIPPNKDGVGVWFDLGENHDVRRIDLDLAVAGATVEVWVADEPPQPVTAPADWGSRVGGLRDAPRASSIEVDRDDAGRVWLIWFTELPAVDEGFRAELATVGFHAR